MQVQQKLFNKIVFTLNFFKSSTMLFLVRSDDRASLLPCFLSLFLCSVFKVQKRVIPSKLNNVRRKGLTLGHYMRLAVS